MWGVYVGGGGEDAGLRDAIDSPTVATINIRRAAAFSRSPRTETSRVVIPAQLAARGKAPANLMPTTGEQHQAGTPVRSQRV